MHYNRARGACIVVFEERMYKALQQDPAMNYQNIITMEPGKRGGRPCIRGMRIAVSETLGWLAVGMSHDEIINDYPEITEEDIRACLGFAADCERRVLTTV
jgi:uncharacterized protein (DUF433 family)